MFISFSNFKFVIMCFKTRSMDNKASVATKDIIAFKLMKHITLTEAHSPFRPCAWRIGKIKRSDLPKTLRYHGQEIEVGLHCFKTAGSASNYSFKERDNKLVVVMIPKGALYYENRTQYVSNKMIFLGDAKIFKKAANVLK